MANASVAFGTARALLNDVGATLWTDAVLLPFLQEAHRELQVKLYLKGLPVLKEVSTVLSVPANTTNLSSVGSFPTDVIEPIWLKEKLNGEADSRFIDMEEVDFIPDIERDTRNRYWCWREEVINILGATVATQVKLRYTKGLTLPTSNGSALGFIFAESYIGPRCAALAAQSVDNVTLYEAQTMESQAKIDEILRANVKGMQNLGARRRPYHRKYRRLIT